MKTFHKWIFLLILIPTYFKLTNSNTTPVCHPRETSVIFDNSQKKQREITDPPQIMRTPNISSAFSVVTLIILTRKFFLKQTFLPIPNPLWKCRVGSQHTNNHFGPNEPKLTTEINTDKKTKSSPSWSHMQPHHILTWYWASPWFCHHGLWR
jgi:hypothetical protein